MKVLAVALIISAAATSAFAVDAETVDKSYELKDGSTVYIFKDGKMGMEDKYGKARVMKDGTIMETKDGQKIMMKGNEVYRIEALNPWRRGS